MAWNKRIENAYEALDKAVEELRSAYMEADPDDSDSTSVLLGWVVLTAAINYKPDSNDDPLDTQAISGWFSKRGQNSILSYGIVQEGIRHYNRIQHEGG